MAAWVRLPEVPVIVSVLLPLGVPPVVPRLSLLLQPPITMKKNIAAIVIRRARKFCAERKRRNMRKARTKGTILSMQAVGGMWRETGGVRSIAACGAVVVTVTRAVDGLVPSGVTGVATVQVEFAGAPVHVSATAELKPPEGVTVTLKVVAAP